MRLTSFHKKLDVSRNQTSDPSWVGSIKLSLQEKNQTPRRLKTIIGVHSQLNLHYIAKTAVHFDPFTYFCLYFRCFLTNLLEIWTESTNQEEKTFPTIEFAIKGYTAMLLHICCIFAAYILFCFNIV